MKGYLSIGKVAKLKGVSIKSLRYYDEIGILKPAYINKQTNYRYYKEEQLMLIDAISLCIELGIPLKDFDHYRDESGSLNFSELLFDGKLLAEKKIRSMSRHLETLQQTLTMLESQKKEAASYEIKPLYERTLLLLPLDDCTVTGNSSPKLLELLVAAQKSGLTSSYPSGILHICTKGQTKTYVFIHIVENHSVSKTLSPGVLKSLSGTNCFLLTLPRQNYACHESVSSSINQSEQIFGSLLSNREDYTLLELKNIEMKKATSTNLYELQLLLS